jgi:hypothetical protein
MRAAAFALIFAAAALAQGQAEDPSDVEISLANGSNVRGVLRSPKEFKVKSKDETKTVAFSDLRSLRRGNVKAEEYDVAMTKTGAVKGWFEEWPPVVVDTGFGVLEIPAADIKWLRRIDAGAFEWTFEGESLDGWTPVGNSRWQAAGGVLELSTPGAGDFIRLDEQLAGPVTIEVDITSDDWAAVAWNADDRGAMTAFWIIQGQCGVYGSGSWTGTPVTRWPLQLEAGKAAKVKVELDGAKAKCWVNGTLMGEAPAKFDTGRIALAGWTSKVTFDNLKISR